MKVTVCQLHDQGEPLEEDWRNLATHVRREQSDLVLLPQMPFYTSFVASPRFDRDIWDAAVHAHDRWEKRLAELQSATVMGTRPIDFGNERYDEGFIWSATLGLRGVHAKAWLQSEEGAWERLWYYDATPDFVPMPAGDATVGFLIGSELWAAEEARRYRDGAVDVIVTPRMSCTPSQEDWLAAGREAAILAGAFGLSSARAPEAEPSAAGWIIAPDGELLAMTSWNHPFVSVTLDLRRAQAAKQRRAG